jgi:hypothetical protein
MAAAARLLRRAHAACQARRFAVSPAPFLELTSASAQRRSARVRARSSAGEHYVDIVGVAGSIPAAPTMPSRHSASSAEPFPTPACDRAARRCDPDRCSVVTCAGILRLRDVAPFSRRVDLGSLATGHCWMAKRSESVSGRYVSGL